MIEVLFIVQRYYADWEPVSVSDQSFAAIREAKALAETGAKVRVIRIEATPTVLYSNDPNVKIDD